MVGWFRRLEDKKFWFDFVEDLSNSIWWCNYFILWYLFWNDLCCFLSDWLFVRVRVLYYDSGGFIRIFNDCWELLW